MNKVLLCLSVLITGVFAAQNVQQIRVGQPISVEYPTNMKRSYDLNTDAMLQLSNQAQEKYCIVIQDEKESLESMQIVFGDANEAVEFYSKSLIESMIDNSSRKISKVSQRTVGTYKVAEVTIEGEIEDSEGKIVKTFYLFSVVETPKFYYQILNWTTKANKSKFQDEFRTLVNSFKEVN